MNTFGCEMCKYKCARKTNIARHMLSKKHLDNVAKNVPNEGRNKESEYYCESCFFRCNKQSDYARHINTQKHIQKTQVRIDTTEDTSITESSGGGSSDVVVSTELLVQIVQQNEELIKQLTEERQKNKEQYAELLEYCKEPKHITNNQNHFNVNFFLNVTCKDALNMSDFIRDLEIQIEDIQGVSQLGFVDGITKILVNRLKGLEVHQRPIHCMDVKRDVLYIKDDNRWEKDVENAKLKHVIETVEQRNCRKVCCDMKPDSFSTDETQMEKYMSLLREVNGGGSRDKNHEKIVRNIAKTFVVERNATIT